jgi:hypothetical protein
MTKPRAHNRKQFKAETAELPHCKAPREQAGTLIQKTKSEVVYYIHDVDTKIQISRDGKTIISLRTGNLLSQNERGICILVRTVDGHKTLKGLSIPHLLRYAYGRDEFVAIAAQDKVELTSRGCAGYWVTRDGRVWSDRSINWLAVTDYNGRAYVSVTRRQNGARVRLFDLSKLVAECFNVPNPHQYAYVRPKDGNNFNCQVANLRWVEAITDRESTLHERVVQIRALKKQGWSCKEIAEHLKCARSTVSTYLDPQWDAYAADPSHAVTPS